MNAAGKARQKRSAIAVTKFTKPGDRLLAEPCYVVAILRFLGDILRTERNWLNPETAEMLLFLPIVNFIY